MTLPYILPEQGSKASSEMNKHGYSGVGAESVNHLANKITSTLFPVSEPFFSLRIDPDLELELRERGAKARTALEAYFVELADLADRKMQKLKMRPQLVNYEKHLLISGNACLVFTDRGVKMLGLDSYITKRTAEGAVSLGITCEDILFTDLPSDMQSIVLANNPGKKPEDLDKQKLYTGYQLIDNDSYVITQAVDNIPVMKPKTVSAEKLPAIFGRYTATTGEDYGRGLVEDHCGDFHVVEFLSKARALGAAIMMDIKYLVRPGSLTNVTTFNKAETGTYLQGLADDIVPVQLEKYADHQFISSIISEYTERIGRAFLMLQTQVRDSERTTAYEIQRMANEIDASKGGNYSMQSADLQQPVAVQLLDMISPKLMNDGIEPMIVTGLEALGRARKLEKIMQYTELMGLTAAWPDEIKAATDMREYSDVIASQVGLAITWIKSETKQKKEQGEQSLQERGSVMTDAISSGAGNALGKSIGEGLTQR
jgi:hypothetical protein